MNKYMWEQIENSNYSVSDTGDVKNHKTGRILSQWNQNGYRCVKLTINNKKKNFLVHRLVGQYFITNFNPNLPVHHIDGVRHHNNVSNLDNISTLENNKKRIYLKKYRHHYDFIVKIIELYNQKLKPEEILTILKEEYNS